MLCLHLFQFLSLLLMCVLKFFYSHSIRFRSFFFLLLLRSLFHFLNLQNFRLLLLLRQLFLLLQLHSLLVHSIFFGKNFRNHIPINITSHRIGDKRAPADSVARTSNNFSQLPNPITTCTVPGPPTGPGTSPRRERAAEGAYPAYFPKNIFNSIISLPSHNQPY